MITLTTGDLIAVMIALGVSVALVITTAIQNARLTRSAHEYRKAWLISKQAYDNHTAEANK
jgi:hypothetical protein